MFNNPFKHQRHLDDPIPKIKTRQDAEKFAQLLMAKVTSSVRFDESMDERMMSLYGLLVDLLENNAKSGDDGADIMIDAMRFNGFSVNSSLQSRGYPGRKYKIPKGRYDTEATLIGGAFYCSGCGGMVFDNSFLKNHAHPEFRNLTTDLDHMNLCICGGSDAKW